VSRVVVVGAGLGGLSVAARLARLRHEVVVVEAADVVGGAIGRLSRSAFAWDTGPTFLTLPAALRDLFLKTGKPLETVLDLEPLDPLAHCRFADGSTLDLPNTGVVDVASAFHQAFGEGSGEAWQRFHAHAAQIWTSTRGALVEAPLPRRTELLRRPRLARALAPSRTLRDEAVRFFPDPRQRMVLERYATGSGSDPRRAPAWLCTRPYVEQTFRAWAVRGGMRRVVDAVRDRADGRGVAVRTGCRVDGITTAAGRVDGVRLAGGEVLPADVVISAVDARQLYGDLLEPSERAVEAPPSASVFSLFLGVRGVTPHVRRRSLLFPSDPDVELESVFGEHARPVVDPTMSVHVSRDAAHAPDGDEAWTVQVGAPRHGRGAGATGWTKEGGAADYARHLLDRLAARGFDVRDRVVVAEHRSPADIEQATGAPGGRSHGTAEHGARAAWSRATNRSPIPGLFLVGGSAHPGGGIPLVTMSAAIVAEIIGRA
jgi:phytoene desaturase